MYYTVVRQFAKSLKNLEAILVKAEHHAEAKKFDPTNFVTERLTPDMLPFG